MNNNPFPAADTTDPVARGIARQTPVQRTAPVTIQRTVAGSVVEIFEHRINGRLLGVITLPKPIVQKNLDAWLAKGYDVNLGDHLVADVEAYLDFIGEKDA